MCSSLARRIPSTIQYPKWDIKKVFTSTKYDPHYFLRILIVINRYVETDRTEIYAIQLILNGFLAHLS